MRKKIINTQQQEVTPAEQDWLDLEKIAEVEMTSEDSEFPIEAALMSGQTSGWRAASSGEQIIRFVFSKPQRFKLIKLSFIENHVERTQEYVIRYSLENESASHEIVRQQWNFSPEGATSETEEYQVNLDAVSALELFINPDINRGEARASLQTLQLA